VNVYSIVISVTAGVPPAEPPTALTLTLPAISDETVDCTATFSADATEWTVVPHGDPAPVHGVGTWTPVGETHVHTTALSGTIELDAYGWSDAGGVSVTPATDSTAIVAGLILVHDLEPGGYSATGELIDRIENRVGATKYCVATGSYRPTYSADGPNGYPCLIAGGAALMWYATGAFNALTAGEIIYVLKNDADPPVAGNGGLSLYGAAGTRVPSATGIVMSGFGSTVLHDTSNPAETTTNWCIYSEYAASGQWRNFLNGASLTDELTNTVAWINDRPTLAGSWIDGALRWRGRIAAVYMFDHVLSDPERSAALAAVSAKYDIPLA
jgi:hypothetical protein